MSSLQFYCNLMSKQLIIMSIHGYKLRINNRINPSTLRPKGRSMLRIDTERRLIPRPTPTLACARFGVPTETKLSVGKGRSLSAAECINFVS